MLHGISTALQFSPTLMLLTPFTPITVLLKVHGTSVPSHPIPTAVLCKPGCGLLPLYRLNLLSLIILLLRLWTIQLVLPAPLISALTSPSMLHGTSTAPQYSLTPMLPILCIPIAVLLMVMECQCCRIQSQRQYYADLVVDCYSCIV